MTEPTADAAEIDEDAPEPDTATDAAGDLDADAQSEVSTAVDTSQDDDEPPFTPADYEAAAAELAAEAEAAEPDADQNEENPQSDHDDTEAEPGPLDDPKVANLVAKLRREAAENRVARQQVEERLQAASDVIAELQQWQEQRMHRDVESLAAGHKLIDAGEIWHVANLGDFLDDETGDLDEAKVAEVIEQRVPSHWKVQLRFPDRRRAAQSGATGYADIRGPSSWSEVLGQATQ